MLIYILEELENKLWPTRFGSSYNIISAFIKINLPSRREELLPHDNAVTHEGHQWPHQTLCHVGLCVQHEVVLYKLLQQMVGAAWSE